MEADDIANQHATGHRRPERRLDIIVAANEGYRRLLGAMLASIIDTHRESIRQTRITLLDGGFLPRTSRRLKRWSDNNELDLNMVRVSARLYKDVLGNSTFLPPSLHHFARLLGPYMLPPESESAIYLDVDTLVTGSLIDATQIDLKGNVVGCVLEPGIRRFDCPDRGVAHFAELGIPGDAPYFNSGMLVIDTRKWIDEQISIKALDATRLYNADLSHGWDQYALNIVLHGKWYPLGREWNEMEEYRAGQTRVRHFAWKKPTVRESDVSDQDLFFKYLDMSPWKGWRPRKTKPRIRRKIEEAVLRGIIDRLLPGISALRSITARSLRGQ